MPAARSTTVDVRTAVSVSITVVVGDESKTFSATGVALDDGDPFRLAWSMTYAVQGDAANYLMEHERG